ncbi:hypothetical protein J3R82DRAFT_9538 [Butyriboletus roseoflavus]|nr:hypothetical protein J3R82DRAFT_9538 [Butyriboletus roseoflavus]
MVFHGYGDLGIIISAIAKSHGLSVNHNGLKVSVAPDITVKSSQSNDQVPSPQPDPPIHLTSSVRLILDFMGLSMDRWMKGFETVEETFKFAMTSRFFDPCRLHAPSMRTFNKSVQARSMYIDFLVWAQDKPPATSTPKPHQDTAEEALVVFGKKLEWDATAQERYARTWLKSNFNGKIVAEFTGLGWKGVKAVMDDVRSSVGGERALVGMELEQVKSLVLTSQKLLKLDA